MKALIFFVLIVISGITFSADHASMTVNPGQNQFQVVLPANPSTGFGWTVLGYDRAVINMIHSEYKPPNSNLIGAGGRMHFVFELVNGTNLPSSTIITFQYARPWEPQTAKQLIMRVDFAATQ